MYAECPMCSTLLQVSEDQLAVKRGMVRCGHCNEVFDASDHCHEQVEAAMPTLRQPEPDALQLATQVLPQSEDEIFLQRSQAEDSVEEEGATDSTEKAEQTSENKAELLPWEEVSNQPPIIPRSRFALWTVALMSLLAIQLWHFESDQILHAPQLRPHLDLIAQAVKIELPLYEDRATLSIIDRELRPHPEQSNALRFSLTLQNLAPFPQAYPVVRLSLNDEQQQVVAQAYFQPHDYLSGVQVLKGIAAQSSTELTIDFFAPEQSVDGFEFDLI